MWDILGWSTFVGFLFSFDRMYLHISDLSCYRRGTVIETKKKQYSTFTICSNIDLTSQSSTLSNYQASYARHVTVAQNQYNLSSERVSVWLYTP